ncbi:MAG: hypothetical protein ACI8Q2_000230 [Candidatus Omnitrophota bacterium]|jgi:hypothetical protein
MKKPKKQAPQFSSIGIQMAVGMGVFTYCGYWIDQRVGAGQLATLIGMFFGLFYCGYEVWKFIKCSDDE